MADARDVSLLQIYQTCSVPHPHPDISFDRGDGLGRVIATEAGDWLLIFISTDVQNEYSYICTLPQPFHNVRRKITVFFSSKV
jgi:hypothetical protein